MSQLSPFRLLDLLILLSVFGAFGVFLPADVSAQELAVGAALPLSGTYAPLGKQLKDAATLAAKEHGLRLVVADTQGTPEGAVNAIKELAETLFFGKEIELALAEFNEKKTRESLIAHDADQLSLILQLKEYGDLGNKYSKEWIEFAVKRLSTEAAKELAEVIINTDSSEWWFKDKSDWWINANNK